MANDILNSEILQTKPQDKATASKSGVEVKKEKSSLFDNLLKDAKQKAETNAKTQNIVGQESNLLATHKPKNKVLENTDIKHNATQISPTTITSSNKIEIDLKQPQEQINIATPKVSLFDRMSSEVKKNTANKQVAQIEIAKQTVENNKIPEANIPSKTTISSKINSEIKSQTQEVAPKILKKPLEQSTDKKETSSLLDRMVKNIDSKNIAKPESTVAVAKVAENSTSTTTKKPEASVENILAQSQHIAEQKLQLKADIKKVTKDTIGEEPKGQMSAEALESLLGQLAKKLKESMNSESKIDATIKNLPPEIISFNMGETKNGKSNVDDKQKDSKAVSILASLADSLSGKIKSQKKTAETLQDEQIKDTKVPFGANIFLSNQKTNGDLLVQQKIYEAKDVLKSGEQTTKTVKKSADILELNGTNLEVSVEPETKESNIKTATAQANEKALHSQQALLGRMFLSKDVVASGFNQLVNQVVTQKISEEKISEIKASVEDTKKLTNDVNITVERTLAEAFTTKVIASKQLMGSFMSDVARNMYLNYKPPVTAFKITLDPINLGNISIVMKSNKAENSLSVSLNMSQNSTLDTFTDNKSALQNALARTFNSNETNFSLDFGMQNESSNQEFEQFRQNEQNKNHSQNENDVKVLQAIEETILAEDLITTKSYM
ncbi:MAG: flagellar hook-length control protein FliK [Arcobacter sp.]|nr:flagellar hook-length control protein FliK [Arcobacter sp.]